MEFRNPSRRQFIQTTAAMAGAAMLSPMGQSGTAMAQATRRSATDIVTLNKTGLKLSRLGLGTGVNNGMDNLTDGRDAFIKTVRHAYDQGITYIDCAERYRTFSAIGDAIKGLPREKLFIQSKIWPAQNQDIAATIDRHRKLFNTDYFDSLLIHCRTEKNWTELWKPIMEAFDTAKEKKWIRAKGVSCHSMAALELSGTNAWSEVHLVRCNPQGIIIDGPTGGWTAQSVNSVDPVVVQIKKMHDQGRGVIGMKIFGNGFITDPAEQEKSIRFAMDNPNIDAIVIGMANQKQVDDNLKMVNKVLAAMV